MESRLWFHGDIRDNFYYASYLFAAAADSSAALPFDRDQAVSVSSAILLEVLKLQDRNPDSATYGHWPLRLDPVPQEAPVNTLPAELMGSLMAYFYHRYEWNLAEPLRDAFQAAFYHMYRSRFFQKPLRDYNHHEAKYTAAKLIFGQWFEDEELSEDGRSSLRETLRHVRTKGMSEYGCLPWFWHWVQAFTCAWELIRDPAVKADLSTMLDYLWNERALFYLKGTWAGPHSRGLPHDIPRDSNVLFDYVQFGDFELPDKMPRTEYAGFLFYEAPEAARRTALDRYVPAEVAKTIIKTVDSREVRLHSYTYITERFAAGGVWERFREFDNEQHRWDVTLPLTKGNSVNQAYFFHPGKGHSGSDPRHQSDYTEVLFEQNVIMALYRIPEHEEDTILGILPKGMWLTEASALYGLVNDVYFAVFFMQPYLVREEEDRLVAASVGRSNGIVMEVVDAEQVRERGIESLEAFAGAMRSCMPKFVHGAALQVGYRSLHGKRLQLSVDAINGRTAKADGNPVDFTNYRL